MSRTESIERLPETACILRPGEVRVRIAASGENPLDTKIRAGKADHAKTASVCSALGLDMAGIAEEIAEYSDCAFSVGDEVYGTVGGVGGLQGTLAESITCDARLIAHKPENLSMRQAAALPLSVITSWEALVDRAKVHTGQSVLHRRGSRWRRPWSGSDCSFVRCGGFCNGFAGEGSDCHESRRNANRLSCSEGRGIC